jgi:glucose/mannose-6-phosphate isomerase
MKQHVVDFTKHLAEALEIGSNANFKLLTKSFSNILISGLGGSGIGGTIVSQLVADEAKMPIGVNKNYGIPAYVSDKTLFIACSYSGNTEETLDALSKAEAKGAEIACVTSGGELLDIAKNKGYNYIKVPEGFPPRAALGVTLPQLYFMLENYEVVSKSFKEEVANTIALINKEEELIKEIAATVAEKLFEKTPVIYSVSNFEGVAVRFRQQINENAKMLCWHHAIPEMNHNELVGWAGVTKDHAVVIFRNESDYLRNQSRIEINKAVIEKYACSITEIYSKGNTNLERALYHIHVGDWISVMLADKKQIDPTEVDVIDFLKESLAKS